MFKNNINVYIFFGFTLITIILIAWSVNSLKLKDRGKILITTGIFKYLRHPLYASFLSVFNFGLAILMNNWIYIIWVISLFPMWNLLIIKEEKTLEQIFPNDYEEYCKKTGRFIPKF
jgi:protein-S-isoprenylcysteine O-methyltransferase Ste14